MTENHNHKTNARSSNELLENLQESERKMTTRSKQTWAAPAVASGIDRDTIHELLLAQRYVQKLSLRFAEVLRLFFTRGTLSLGGKVLDGGICGSKAGVESFLMVVILRLVLTPFRVSVERLDLSPCVCRHLVYKSCNKPITCDTGLIFTAAATAHKQRRTLNLVMRTREESEHCSPQQVARKSRNRRHLTPLKDNEAEGENDQGPPESIHEQIARVAEGHHRRRSHAEAPTQFLRLLNVSHTAPGSSPASPFPSLSSPPHSQVVVQRTREFSSAAGHSTHCCAYTQVHQDPTLTGWQINWLIHLQPVRESLASL